VIQPNINPYVKTDLKYLRSNLIHLADSLSNSSVDYLLAPETAIEDEIWENSPTMNYAIQEQKHFLKRFPKTSFVFGARTLREYPVTAKITPTAQPFKKSAGYYDCFNAAVQIDSSSKIQFYHKSRLVVGVEKMPYPKALKWLEKSIIRFGGSFSSYGTQPVRGVFESAGHKMKIAPVICFESAYGEFVTGYINNGAGLIFILTNDAWWGNTPGHCQLLNYARLRAIETRRSIARSANTGISAFINQRGEITSSLEWGIKGGIAGVLNANSYKTFYVRHGDLLGPLSWFISVLILLIVIWSITVKKKLHGIF
jgi:apolipoprotein N-acyltransferase